jgi:hypothetical protein
MGFRFVGRLYGGAPTIRTLKLKDGEEVETGDMVAASTEGTIAVATSAKGYTDMWGAVTEIVAESSASYCQVVTDPDAIYEIVDATARYAGDTCDIDASGSVLITATASNDGRLIVVANSGSDYATQVMIANGYHVLTHAWAVTTGSRVA